MVGPVRVLCADDQRDVADSTGVIFRLFGCDVQVCYDGPTPLDTSQLRRKWYKDEWAVHAEDAVSQLTRSG